MSGSSRRRSAGGGPEVSTVDEYYRQAGPDMLNRMNDVARRDSSAVDDEAVDWAAGRVAEAPGSIFCLFLNLAAKDERRRGPLIARYRALMNAHPRPPLSCAGYNLHEY